MFAEEMFTIPEVLVSDALLNGSDDLIYSNTVSVFLHTKVRHADESTFATSDEASLMYAQHVPVGIG